MNKSTSEFLAIAVIKELNRYGGFDHWWDMIDELDKLIILEDISVTIRKVYEETKDD